MNKMCTQKTTARESLKDIERKCFSGKKRMKVGQSQMLPNVSKKKGAIFSERNPLFIS
jgi:hypothetical protein